MEENKKNNMGLIVLVIVLIICLIGLIGFVVYSNLSSFNHNNTDNNTTTTTTTAEQKVYDGEKNDISIINKGSNIDLSFKKSDDGITSVMIDNKVVTEIDTMSYCPIDNAVLLDNEYFLIIFQDCVEGNYALLYDVNGDMKHNMSDFIDNGIPVYSIWLENEEIKGIILGYGPDYEFAACRYKPSEIVYGDVTFKYSGNGQFTAEITNTATQDEIVHRRYGASCEEIKNSTSEELSYEREMIKTYDNN